MAIQIQGNGGTVAEVDGTGFRAVRVAQRPLDVGALGAYRLSVATGVMAAGLAANSEIFQFRWTDATRLCVIHRLIFDGMGGIVAFTAGSVVIQALVARSFTAAGTGGTAATITGNNQKVRTSHGTTLLGEARVATTAALGAGTKTLDSQAFGQVASGISATAGDKVPEGTLFDSTGGQEHPIVLAQNEGVVVRATVPATGTWTGGVSIAWSEVSAY